MSWRAVQPSNPSDDLSRILSRECRINASIIHWHELNMHNLLQRWHQQESQHSPPPGLTTSPSTIPHALSHNGTPFTRQLALMEQKRKRRLENRLGENAVQDYLQGRPLRQPLQETSTGSSPAMVNAADGAAAPAQHSQSHTKGVSTLFSSSSSSSVVNSHTKVDSQRQHQRVLREVLFNNVKHPDSKFATATTAAAAARPMGSAHGSGPKRPIHRSSLVHSLHHPPLERPDAMKALHGQRL